MANTTNLNLVKPAGTDHALVSVINGNMDIIDSKVGAIPENESAQSQITALNNQIATLNTAVSNTNQNNNWCTLSSAESGAVKNCRKIGKAIYIDFIGNNRTHTEGETILTLNSGFRPVASCKITGSINGTAVILNADATSGDVTIFLINGATGSGRLYCNCAIAIN